MEETLYVFHSGGILEGTKEWYDEILPENIATSYLDIVNGKHMLANSEQILFYKEHPDYDLYHLYYMIFHYYRRSLALMQLIASFVMDFHM